MAQKNNGNDPEQTTTRIERVALQQLKEIAKHTKRSVPKALSILIAAEHERIVPKPPINVTRR